MLNTTIREVRKSDRKLLSVSSERPLPNRRVTIFGARKKLYGAPRYSPLKFVNNREPRSRAVES